MQNTKYVSPEFARQLILDELFDLSLYKRFREISGPELHPTLDELIKVENGHLGFWQELFKVEISELNFARRLKLEMIVLVCRLFGAPAIDLILEAIEVYGIRKYLTLWKQNKDYPMGKAVHGILKDEFEHEDVIVGRLKEIIINPDRIRNIFLGLNDGMVEILGAVAGFFASFGQNTLVLVAGLTTPWPDRLRTVGRAQAARLLRSPRPRPSTRFYLSLESDKRCSSAPPFDFEPISNDRPASARLDPDRRTTQ
ncbi:MAG: hypothetical protein MPW14_03645 [Candidatus Manganitrophus sp.]|nr:hypothetical protein [Candidatus Manganitrophus sp.]MDC4227125.1 hypothetical protein [Candidatus Manganitrophus sp.]WDT71741.1 MAG: hypothetical protein MPW17_02540 [Candidatus Manganitrophus sp.]WDT80888.1 MAG: hypothetical protein MPW14_03645 [Candidatus Manganitrophus sp.]